MDDDIIYAIGGIVLLVVVVVGAVGVPGNVLSAIVWLRVQVSTKNSSAVYLTAIAINDLIHVLTFFPYFFLGCKHSMDSWA